MFLGFLFLAAFHHLLVIDMQLSNDKLVNRGIMMLCKELHINKTKANQLLQEYGSVRKAIKNYK